jgi:nucleoside phosphorylase
MSLVRLNFGGFTPPETEIKDALSSQLRQILAEVDIETESSDILLLSASARNSWLELDIGRLAINFLNATFRKLAKKSSELGEVIDQHQASLPSWGGLRASFLLDNFEHHLLLSEKSNHARFFKGLGNFHCYLNAWKSFIPFLNEQAFARIEWHLIENDWLPVFAIVRMNGPIDPKAYWHHLNDVRNLANLLQATDVNLQEQSGSPTSKVRSVLFLVSVMIERKALLEELRAQGFNPKDGEIDGRYVDTFSISGRNSQSWHVIVGQGTEKGPHAAQALVHDLAVRVGPEIIILLGMCGGLPEHGATETSVIVARQVTNYEPTRFREGQSAWSPTTYRTAARITDLTNALASRNTFPDLHIVTNKDYGSGEKLIDDLSSELRGQLLSVSGDLIGFEMEGHGMLHGLWELQRNNVAIQATIIKGVSDFGNGQMQENKERRQVLATRRAARLALEILRAY